MLFKKYFHLRVRYVLMTLRCSCVCMRVENLYFRTESSILHVLPCIHTKVVCHASVVTHLRSCHSSLW